MENVIRERAAELFSALSNPIRMRIVEALVDREMSVNEVALDLGISQSGASQHLTQLARVGVVVATPRGTTRIYSVRGPRIGRILSLIEEFCIVHQLRGRGSEEQVEGPVAGS
jgi:DNA-binding transcriptional ArsR family regulator